MTERPILFSGAMVRAILEGRKTQTRRLVTCRHPISFIGPAGEEHDPRFWGYFFDGPDHNGYMVLGRGLNDRQNNGLISMPCPYGVPGDRLWVRETFAIGALRTDPDPGASGFDDALSWTARGAYAVLWDAINAKRALWSSNPWVWAVTFAVVR